MGFLINDTDIKKALWPISHIYIYKNISLVYINIYVHFDSVCTGYRGESEN